MDVICKIISEITSMYCVNFKTVDMLGFSMGGHISIYYTYFTYGDDCYFNFNKLLLINPLTNLYLPYPILVNFVYLYCLFTFLISPNIDIQTKYYEFECQNLLELEDIYSHEKLKKYCIDDFDVEKIGGYSKKQFTNGNVINIFKNIKEITSSKTKINKEIICILSESYGNEPLKQDNVCNPADTEYFLQNHCENFKIHKFECGHNALKQPFYSEVNFIEISKKLFEIENINY